MPRDEDDANLNEDESDLTDVIIEERSRGRRPVDMTTRRERQTLRRLFAGSLRVAMKESSSRLYGASG